MHQRDEKYNFDQCQNCKLVLLNPRVNNSELSFYYPNYYLPYRGSKAWGKYAHLVDKSQKKLDHKRASLLANYHRITSQTTVLDIGCGQPTFLEACKKQFNANCIGIDFSNNGWKSDPKRYHNLNLSIAEVHTLSEEIKPDYITMWHYLEHDYNPLGTLKKLREIASNKTMLVIEVPNFDSESRKKYGENWAGYHTPRHTFLFSPNNIQQLLENTKWKILDLHINGTLDPYNLQWMSKMEQKNIDWTKNMEDEFWGYVQGMISFRLRQLFQKKSWGVMTIIAQAN